MRTLEYAEGLNKDFLSLFSYSSIITKLLLLKFYQFQLFPKSILFLHFMMFSNRNQTIC